MTNYNQELYYQLGFKTTSIQASQKLRLLFLENLNAGNNLDP